MLPPQSAAPTNVPLSYEDRHYRPGGDSAALTPVSLDGRRNDRNIDNDQRYHIQPPSALTPPASPGLSREPPRDHSPLPPDVALPHRRGRERESRPARGSQRSTRGRQPITDTDSPAQRDHEVRPSNTGFSDRHWAQTPSVPSAEFVSSTDRGSRRPHQQNQPVNNLAFEASTEEDRARLLGRSNSNRVSARDREDPRSLEHREQLHQMQSIPTPSTLSASSSLHLSYAYAAEMCTRSFPWLMESLDDAVSRALSFTIPCLLYCLRLLSPPFFVSTQGRSSWTPSVSSLFYFSQSCILPPHVFFIPPLFKFYRIQIPGSAKSRTRSTLRCARY